MYRLRDTPFTWGSTGVWNKDDSMSLVGRSDVFNFGKRDMSRLRKEFKKLILNLCVLYEDMVAKQRLAEKIAEDRRKQAKLKK